MFELMDGIISLACGVWCYLVIAGKLKIGKSEDDSIRWVNSNRKLLKIVGPILVVFGLFRLSQALFIA